MKVDRGQVILSKEEAGKATPDTTGLPPPGHKRDEVLRKRADELEAKIDDLTSKLEVGTVDPDALEPDNEILQFASENVMDSGSFPVTDADELYTYCWVFRDPSGRYGGIQIMRKKIQGWQLCHYGNPETAGMKSAEGYCVIGDTLLMRIRKDRYLSIRKREYELAQRRRFGVDSELKAMGEKYRDKGVIVHTPDNIDNATLERMDKKASAERKAKALSDKWIREGRMPGVPGPSQAS
jgi:hypothetical protein